MVIISYLFSPFHIFILLLLWSVSLLENRASHEHTFGNIHFRTKIPDYCQINTDRGFVQVWVTAAATVQLLISPYSHLAWTKKDEGKTDLIAFLSGHLKSLFFSSFADMGVDTRIVFPPIPCSIHPNKSFSPPPPLQSFLYLSNKGCASRVSQKWFLYLILHIALPSTAVPQHQAALILQRYPMETFYELHYTDRRGAKFCTCRKQAKKERWMNGRYSKFIRFSHRADKADVCPGLSRMMEVLLKGHEDLANLTCFGLTVTDELSAVC